MKLYIGSPVIYRGVIYSVVRIEGSELTLSNGETITLSQVVW
jgi:hypothetical protein